MIHFFSQNVGRKQLFWFFEALARVKEKKPNVLFERWVLSLQRTEKGFAKCGNSKNWKFKNSETKQMLFQIV
jgi:hypothetical protein